MAKAFAVLGLLLLSSGAWASMSKNAETVVFAEPYQLDTSTTTELNIMLHKQKFEEPTFTLTLKCHRYRKSPTDRAADPLTCFAVAASPDVESPKPAPQPQSKR